MALFTEDARIDVLGTQFAVDRDGSSHDTVVSVVEGRVRVTPLARSDTAAARPAATATESVSAGEQVRVSAALGAQHLPAGELTESVCWRTGRYQYDGVPLSSVIAFLNACTGPPIRIADRGLASQHFFGVVSFDHPGALLRLLQLDRTLEVDVKPDEVVIRRRGSHLVSGSPANP